MERYFDAHTVRRFRDCVVCFAHVCHKDLPEHRVWGYDNLELKQILDSVGVWLLTDDGGLLCNRLPHHQTGRYGLHPYVYYGKIPVPGMVGGAWDGRSRHRGYLSKSAEKVMIFEKIPYPIFPLLRAENGI